MNVGYNKAQLLMAGMIGFGMGVVFVALMPVNLEKEYIPATIEERVDAAEIESLDQLLEAM